MPRLVYDIRVIKGSVVQSTLCFLELLEHNLVTARCLFYQKELTN